MVAVVQQAAAGGQKEHHIALGHVVQGFCDAAGHRVVHAGGVHNFDPGQLRQGQGQLAAFHQWGKAPFGAHVVVDAAQQLLDAVGVQLHLALGQQRANAQAVVAPGLLHQLARGAGGDVLRFAGRQALQHGP